MLRGKVSSSSSRPGETPFLLLAFFGGFFQSKNPQTLAHRYMDVMWFLPGAFRGFIQYKEEEESWLSCLRPRVLSPHHVSFSFLLVESLPSFPSPASPARPRWRRRKKNGTCRTGPTPSTLFPPATAINEPVQSDAWHLGRLRKWGAEVRWSRDGCR